MYIWCYLLRSEICHKIALPLDPDVGHTPGSEMTGYLIFIFILQITLSSKLLDLIPITMHMKMIMAKVIGVLIQIRQKIHSFCMHSFESFDFISHPLF